MQESAQDIINRLGLTENEVYTVQAPDGRELPVLRVDGWYALIANHPEFTGIEFNYSENMVERAGCNGNPVTCHEWIEAVIHRKDRTIPIAIREYAIENFNPYLPAWETHPIRQLRHKAAIQCARVAFGFGGIYDPDEAGRIQQSDTNSSVANNVGTVTVSPKPKEAEKKPKQEDAVAKAPVEEVKAKVEAEKPKEVEAKVSKTPPVAITTVDDTKEESTLEDVQVSEETETMVTSMINASSIRGTWNGSRELLKKRLKDPAELQWALSQLDNAEAEEALSA